MATCNSVITFIERQQELLLKERDTELQYSNMLQSKFSPKLLEQRGLALTNLGIANISIGLGGRSMITLERPIMFHSIVQLPEHSFRPGDIARIEAHLDSKNRGARSGHRKKAKQSFTAGSLESASTEGVVYKEFCVQISDVQIVVAVDEEKRANRESSIPPRCRLVKLVNMATFNRMEKALETVKRMYGGEIDSKGARTSPSSLSDVLLGVSAPSEPQPSRQREFYNTQLNTSQMDAVAFALSAAEVACIHGPPGTGKTHTLIEIIRQLLFGPPGTSDGNKPHLGMKLLVCGASNLSVDNILERVLKLPKDRHGEILCTRVGHPARVMNTDAILDETLDAQVIRSDQAELARDVKKELEQMLGILTGKSKPQRGHDVPNRKKMWETVRELRKEYRRRERASVEEITKKVVFATCHTAGGSMLSEVVFDVVIIDEATQAMEAACWIPILKGKKLIIAGDPMQLPPTILSRKVGESKTRPSRLNTAEARTDESEGKLEKALPLPETLELTLFERLEKMYGSSIKRMLQIQYRMHKHICAYPSSALYENRLISDSSVAEHLLVDLVDETRRNEPECEDILGRPLIFFDTSGCEYFEKSSSDSDEGSKYNENEAVIVKMWLESLVDLGIHVAQVAILAPYQAQVSYLSNILRPSFGRELEIGTVDGMQGREKEAVILTLVRSNEEREVGFLKDTRRLNVAMTRARRQLCVVGDAYTVKNGGPYLKNWMNWLEENADVRYGGIA